jgi:hypothetical protein
MEKKLTLQTAAAFERIHEAIVGKTDDELKTIHVHITKLLTEYNRVAEIADSFNCGDY